MSDARSDAGGGIAAEAVETVDREDDQARVFGVPTPYVLVAGTVLVGLIAWEVMARVAFDRLEIVFPPLAEIAVELVGLLTDADFYAHGWVTTQEVGIAFAMAAFVGIVGGTIVGSNEFLAKVVEPIIYYFSTVPKIVLYPLFIVALGAASMDSKIAMGFFSAIFPITVNTITGALSVRSDLVKVAQVYQASRLETFLKVYVPSMLTHIVNGLRLGVGVAIIGVILAELFASQAGVGNRVAFFFSNLQTAKMYAALIVIFAVSLGLNLSLLWIQTFLRDRGYGASDSEATFGF